MTSNHIVLWELFTRSQSLEPQSSNCRVLLTACAAFFVF